MAVTGISAVPSSKQESGLLDLTRVQAKNCLAGFSPSMVWRSVRAADRRGGFERLALPACPEILTAGPLHSVQRRNRLDLEILNPRPCSWQIGKSLP
jgi:hypothetical protein